jgi:hypothetical protein
LAANPFHGDRGDMPGFQGLIMLCDMPFRWRRVPNCGNLPDIRMASGWDEI